MQLLWSYYSEPNMLQRNLTIFKEKFQPLFMKRDYGKKVKFILQAISTREYFGQKLNQSRAML